MINWNARQLHAFLQVCRLQSFSRAAEQVAISPSGMSMLIRDLERQVGAPLFERTTRAVALTEAGRTLQPVAARVLGELGAAGEAIAGTQSERASRLTVAATPMVSANLLPAAMRSFAQSHPAVRVVLNDVDVDGVRHRVLGGEADLGLGFFFKPAVSMRRTPLCKFRLMCIGPVERSRAGLRAERTWRSLADLPLIGLPAHNPIQSLIERHLATVGRGHEERPTMNLIGTIIAMVEAGLGHAILPSFALPDCLRHQIAVSRLTQPAVSIDLMLASRTGTTLSAVASAFAAELKAAATAMDR